MARPPRSGVLGARTMPGVWGQAGYFEPDGSLSCPFRLLSLTRLCCLARRYLFSTSSGSLSSLSGLACLASLATPLARVASSRALGCRAVAVPRADMISCVLCQIICRAGMQRRGHCRHFCRWCCPWLHYHGNVDICSSVSLPLSSFPPAIGGQMGEIVPLLLLFTSQTE